MLNIYDTEALVCEYCKMVCKSPVCISLVICKREFVCQMFRLAHLFGFERRLNNCIMTPQKKWKPKSQNVCSLFHRRTNTVFREAVSFHLPWSVNQSVNQSVNPSVSQSVNQSISQSVTQSIGHSINKSVPYFKKFETYFLLNNNIMLLGSSTCFIGRPIQEIVMEVGMRR